MKNINYCEAIDLIKIPKLKTVWVDHKGSYILVDEDEIHS